LETFLDIQTLTCHAETPGNAVKGVTCTISYANSGNWVFGFIVGCSPALLYLPEARPPARADGLWKTTCFEAFIQDAAGDQYSEFNFSPSGEWAAYRFDHYRKGMRNLPLIAPRIFTSDEAQFALAAKANFPSLPLDVLDTDEFLISGGTQSTQFSVSASLDDPSFFNERGGSLALSAVIEEKDGTKSYWALKHPPGKPDFHHRDCFALTLPAAEKI
jgi:hypothetical protein